MIDPIGVLEAFAEFSPGVDYGERDRGVRVREPARHSAKDYSAVRARLRAIDAELRAARKPTPPAATLEPWFPCPECGRMVGSVRSLKHHWIAKHRDLGPVPTP